METKQLEDLKGNPNNPRSISKEDYTALKNSISKFGDLSGIVFNETTGQLAGGHMRTKAFQELDGSKQIVITQRYDEPTKTGTIAIGYVTLNGETYGYREVRWDEGTEKAANIAANRISGEWDKDLLAQINYELSKLENGADLLSLTGQTEEEISKLLDMVGANGEQVEDEAPPRGRCESCGQPIRGDLPVGQP